MQSPRINYLGNAHGVSSPAVLTSLGALVEAPLVPASSPHQLTLTDDPLVPRPFQRISPIPTASLQSAHSFGESIVQVYAGGYSHKAIRRNPDGTSTAPHKLSNEESNRRISEMWCFYLNRFDSQTKSPLITYSLVVSMSKYLLRKAAPGREHEGSFFHSRCEG